VLHVGRLHGDRLHVPHEDVAETRLVGELVPLRVEAQVFGALVVDAGREPQRERERFLAPVIRRGDQVGGGGGSEGEGGEHLIIMGGMKHWRRIYDALYVKKSA